MEAGTFIKEIYTEDTGGGFECDVMLLDDERVLVVSEDAVVLYPDLDVWENQGGQLGAIVRA